jgi:hypothetical protein
MASGCQKLFFLSRRFTNEFRPVAQGGSLAQGWRKRNDSPLRYIGLKIALGANKW